MATNEVLDAKLLLGALCLMYGAARRPSLTHREYAMEVGSKDLEELRRAIELNTVELTLETVDGTPFTLQNLAKGTTRPGIRIHIKVQKSSKPTGAAA